MPQRNITLVLRAYKRHKITFDYNLDDYGVYKTIYSTEKQDVTVPEDPSVPGYVFKGWYLTADGSGNPYEFDRKLKEDSKATYAQGNLVGFTEEDTIYNRKFYPIIIMDSGKVSSTEKYPQKASGRNHWKTDRNPGKGKSVSAVWEPDFFPCGAL